MCVVNIIELPEHTWNTYTFKFCVLYNSAQDFSGTDPIFEEV